MVALGVHHSETLSSGVTYPTHGRYGGRRESELRERLQLQPFPSARRGYLVRGFRGHRTTHGCYREASAGDLSGMAENAMCECGGERHGRVSGVTTP